MDIRQDESRLEEVREELLADPAQGQAGQGYPKLSRGQIRIQMIADMLCEHRAQVAFTLKSVELARPDLYHRELGRHEEGIQDDEAENDRQLAQNNEGRIPLFDHSVSQNGNRRKGKTKSVHETDARRTSG